MKSKHLLLTALLTFATATACTEAIGEAPSCNEPAFEEFVEELARQEQYESIYWLALPCAEAGNPELQFAVGILISEWKIDNRSEAEWLQEALRWFRKAAVNGHEEARRLLADSYKYGWNGLKQNDELATCWRSTISGEVQAEDCLKVEKSIETILNCPELISKETRRDFDSLYEELKSFQEQPEIRLSSRTGDHVDHESFREIVRRGEDLLPLIILVIAEGDFFMNVAMREITQTSMEAYYPEDYPSGEIYGEQTASKGWLRWWKENEPDWCRRHSSEWLPEML